MSPKPQSHLKIKNPGKLEDYLDNLNNYKAFFQTSIALTIDNQNSVCFDGIVSGKISDKPLGSRGFHYDPIFMPDGANKTFAQMLEEEKNKISHRAIAIKKLKHFIINLID